MHAFTCKISRERVSSHRIRLIEKCLKFLNIFHIQFHLYRDLIQKKRRERKRDGFYLQKFDQRFWKPQYPQFRYSIVNSSGGWEAESYNAIHEINSNKLSQTTSSYFDDPSLESLELIWIKYRVGGVRNTPQYHRNSFVYLVIACPFRGEECKYFQMQFIRLD